MKVADFVDTASRSQQPSNIVSSGAPHMTMLFKGEKRQNITER